MLYKFKSRATADLIMLEPQGRQMVQIIGKTPGPKGIVTVEQIPGAIAALQAAVAAEEALPQAPDLTEEEREEQRSKAVSLRQRATPLIDMLRRSAAEDADVVWGA